MTARAHGDLKEDFETGDQPNQAEFRDLVDTFSKMAMQRTVKDKDTLTPPGSPTTGDRYVISGTGTGAWAGQDQNIAEWDGTAWRFDTAFQGMMAYVVDEAVVYVYNGTSWVTFAVSAGINFNRYESYNIANFAVDSVLIDAFTGTSFVARANYDVSQFEVYVHTVSTAGHTIGLHLYESTDALTDATKDYTLVASKTGIAVDGTVGYTVGQLAANFKCTAGRRYTIAAQPESSVATYVRLIGIGVTSGTFGFNHAEFNIYNGSWAKGTTPPQTIRTTEGTSPLGSSTVKTYSDSFTTEVAGATADSESIWFALG